MTQIMTWYLLSRLDTWGNLPVWSVYMVDFMSYIVTKIPCCLCCGNGGFASSSSNTYSSTGLTGGGTFNFLVDCTPWSWPLMWPCCVSSDSAKCLFKNLHWTMAMICNFPFRLTSAMYSLWGNPPPHVDIESLVWWWLVRRRCWWLQLMMGAPREVQDLCACARSLWMVPSISNWGIYVHPGCRVQWFPNFYWWNLPGEVSTIIYAVGISNPSSRPLQRLWLWMFGYFRCLTCCHCTLRNILHPQICLRWKMFCRPIMVLCRLCDLVLIPHVLSWILVLP